MDEQNPHQPEEIRADLDKPFEEVPQEVETVVEESKPEVSDSDNCPECSGTGLKNAETLCPSCEGSGKLEKKEEVAE